MKKRFNKISVDAGSVAAYLTEKKPANHFLPISKGLYKIDLSVKNCWNGPNENYDFLEVEKDCYLKVSDIGHLDELGIKDEEIHKKGCLLGTGGDGDFAITVELTPIKSIPYNPYEKKLNEAKAFLAGKKYSDELSDEFYKKFCKGYNYTEFGDMLLLARLTSLQAIHDELKAILALKDNSSDDKK